MANKISVIIPTKGERGPLLLRAIESVASQIGGHEIEIIIADDSLTSLDENAIRAAAGVNALRIIQTSKERGLARQFGVEAATGDWVSFLDDDDEWDAKKLSSQLRLAQEIQGRNELPVVSCRLRHHFAESERRVGGIPARLIASGEDVAHYLFAKRPAHVGRPSIYTSTLFTTATVARSIPWQTVPRHQDWDWLVRVQELPGVRIAHCPEELVTVTVGSEGSISAANDWSSSLDWASDVLGKRGNAKTYVDFLVAQPLRYALQGRQLTGVISVIREIWSVRTCPSIRASLTGLSGLASRRMLVRAMSMRSLITIKKAA